MPDVASMLADEAIRLLREAIHLAPKLIELHTAMAKVLKHAGDNAGAAEAAVHAQSIDLADRWIFPLILTCFECPFTCSR